MDDWTHLEHHDDVPDEGIELNSEDVLGEAVVIAKCGQTEAGERLYQAWHEVGNREPLTPADTFGALFRLICGALVRVTCPVCRALFVARLSAIVLATTAVGHTQAAGLRSVTITNTDEEDDNATLH